MSWLFGYNRNNPSDLSNFGLQVPPGTGGGGGSDQGGQNPPEMTSSQRRAMEAYRFDSSALERAAAAAKELEKSSKF